MKALSQAAQIKILLVTQMACLVLLALSFLNPPTPIHLTETKVVYNQGLNGKDGVSPDPLPPLAALPPIKPIKGVDYFDGEDGVDATPAAPCRNETLENGDVTIQCPGSEVSVIKKPADGKTLLIDTTTNPCKITYRYSGERFNSTLLNLIGVTPECSNAS